MIEVVPNEQERLVVVRLSGIVSEADIDGANDHIEHSLAIESARKVMLDWAALEGWEKGARSAGTWVGMRNWANVHRVAVIADEKWADETLRIADIYKVADVRRFGPADRNQGIAWLNEI